jgi:hypothetical protein
MLPIRGWFQTLAAVVFFEKPYTGESGWSASIAYTYSHAKEKLVSNGDYQLDYGHAGYSTFVYSNQLPKHRIVAVGSIDAPWGFNFGGKLNTAS